MTGLTLSQIQVRRGDRLVLDRIDAAFAVGTLTAVIGPNGAGKSTMLSVLAGLQKPDEGLVLLDGVDLKSIEPRVLARRRAYLPQSPRVEWPMPVERVVALGLMPALPVLGDRLPSGREALERALVACDLLDLRSRPATTLSGGELARVMLARAMVGEPELLIVDEPTSGLDPRHAIDACKRLRAHADAGRTVIVALHDLDLAARFSDQVVALREGRIAFAGSAVETIDSNVLSRLFDVNVHVRRDDGVPSIHFY